MTYFTENLRTGDIDWAEYLRKIVMDSRKMYDETLTKADLDEVFDETFLPPCQLELLDSGREAVCLLVHDKTLPDMEFRITENIKGYGESEFARKYKFKNLPSEFAQSKPSTHISLWLFTKNMGYSMPCPQDPSVAVRNILEHLMTSLGLISRKRQIGVIEQSTNGLRRHISRLPQKDVRDDIEEITGKIDTALKEMKRIDEHEKKLVSFEKDMTGMRRLVGESKEFQDWRVMVSDVDILKKNHVSKELFESEIKRLDQRIESLREIKFWSKRTALDIVLAVVATVSTTIATLLAAGIIKLY